MDKINFVKIIVNNKSNRTDREYTYGVPDHLKSMIRIGSRVIVPFGQGNKLIEGFVVETEGSIGFDPSKMKYVKELADEDTILSTEMIELCKWMKETYVCQFIDAIQCIVPTGTALKSKKTIKLKENFDPKWIHSLELSNKQKEIIQYLIGNNHGKLDRLKENFEYDDINPIIKDLEKKGLIMIEDDFKRDVNRALTKMIQLAHDKSPDEILSTLDNRAKKQQDVISYLKDHGTVEWPVLKAALNISLSTIQSLENKGMVEIMIEEKMRTPYGDLPFTSDNHQVLTKEQFDVMEEIKPFIHENTYKPFLIHGVTGSGKTEIYLQLIDLVLKQSKEAIVLLPEISLTTQMIERFKGRFGDIVAILHSKLSMGERYDEWTRIKRGEVKIAIGARSAVFAPFQNLGIMIIDEEHEHTYKSEYTPKYHAGEVAEFRCKANGAILVLGSATPSIETYAKTTHREYTRLELKSRFNNNPMPHVEILDMRHELSKGNKSVFSERLYEEIGNNLAKGEQTILFLNRRGYSTFISCRKCGYVVKCPHCEISLTYHANTGQANCHYCGFTVKPPTTCPACASNYIKYFGVGTEKIEALTKKHFPDARVARLDLDTTSKKGSMDRILNQFKRGNIDIIIGTQMIAKGLDFPNVTLVGVIAADTSLNLPDLRAGERTFQLITQVAGRAGRGDFPGRVIVQTYEPDHFTIVASKTHDYISFFEQEIMLRKAFFYPPYSKLINILFSGTKEQEVIKASSDFADLLRNRFTQHKIPPKDIIFGAHPAPMAKIRQKYRWQIIIKCKPIDLDTIKGIIGYIRSDRMAKDHFKNINISIDINPINML